MTDEEIIQFFKDSGVIVETPTILPSGREVPVYVNFDAIYSFDINMVKPIAQHLAETLKKEELDLEYVVSIDYSSYALAQNVALELGSVLFFTGGDDQFFQSVASEYLFEGRSFLLTTAVLNSGASLRNTIATIHGLGGDVGGVVAIVNNTAVTTELSVRNGGLIKLDLSQPSS